MAKYIRLKDGTICGDGNNYIIDEEGNYCEVRTFMGRSEEVIMISKDNIVKESDNLEDFLEVVVVIRPNGIREVFLDTPKYLVRCFDLDYENCEVYGGIWIKTGIKYFVKKTKNNKMEMI